MGALARVNKSSLWRHAFICVVLSLVVLMTCTCFSSTHLTSATMLEMLDGVGVGDGNVLILLQNSTICEARVKDFTAFSALLVNGSVAVAFGTFKEHPALLVLATGQGHVLRAVLYYVLTGTGALFSGVIEGKHNIVGVGYVALNNTYAGIVARVNLDGGNASVLTYVFSVPTYFRDAIIYGNRVIVAAGAGFSGKYYPAIALISGSDARLIALSPSIGGLEGFAVKAIVTLQEGKPAVLAMRDGETVLFSLTSKGFHAYRLIPNKEFEDVGLVTHPSGEKTTVILKGITPLVVTFPYMNVTLLPLASHYYLVMANRSVLVLGIRYRILVPCGKSFKPELLTLSLEGFNTVEYVTRGKYTNIAIFETIASVKVISSSTHTASQSTTLPSTSTSLEVQAIRTPVRTPGFTLVSGGGGNGLLLIAVGCVLIFASFLLKRFLGV